MNFSVEELQKHEEELQNSLYSNLKKRGFKIELIEEHNKRLAENGFTHKGNGVYTYEIGNRVFTETDIKELFTEGKEWIVQAEGNKYVYQLKSRTQIPKNAELTYEILVNGNHIEVTLIKAVYNYTTLYYIEERDLSNGGRIKRVYERRENEEKYKELDYVYEGELIDKDVEFLVSLPEMQCDGEIFVNDTARTIAEELKRKLRTC